MLASGAESSLLGRLGGFSYDHRWLVISVSLLLALSLSSLIGMGSNFGETFTGEDMESMEAWERVDEAFPVGQSGGRIFEVIFTHEEWNASSPEFVVAVNDAMREIAEHDSIDNVSTPWNVHEEMVSGGTGLISDDGSHVKVIVRFDPAYDEKNEYAEVSELLDCGELECWRTGDVAIDWTFDTRMLNDLWHAEEVAAPITLAILIIVFASVVAALLPLAISLPTVLSGIGCIYWLSHQTDVNIYAMNIISLVGIAVSIDYSLFIVNRFREELDNGLEVRAALVKTSGTAGKAVFFSGLTVAVGLTGLLFYRGTGLPSIGIGGTFAVALAVFFSTTFLMAILALLGERVNSWKVPLGMKRQVDGEGLWANIAEWVMRHPWATLIPIVILLISAAAPFMNVNFGLGGVTLLAPQDEARLGVEVQEDEWAEYASNWINVVFKFEEGENRFDNSTISEMHAFAATVQQMPSVTRVGGIHHPDPSMSASDLQQLYSLSEEYWPPEIQEISNTTSTEEIAILYIVYRADPGSTEAKQLVREVRALVTAEGLDGKVAGHAALGVDVIEEVVGQTPKAVAYILITTTILIFLQVRSVLIPLKAIAMNILSLTASFGMLVFIFQEGHGFENILNFTPQPVDPTTPVILFCIVFGMSMDYEVLMLSRIHETWLETGDNTLAVSLGLQRTGRLITGAAAVMVVVFGSFVLAEVQIIKAIGLGLALAIFIDATLVRALVVPAAMRLMGRANWWSPRWLGGGPSQPREE
jgi:RND superfamily putative drug exporter